MFLSRAAGIVHPNAPRFAALASFLVAATMMTASAEAGDNPMKRLETLSADGLAGVRQLCALGQMPSLKRRLENATAPWPPLHRYCRKAIETAARRGATMTLYRDLVLREQGFAEFNFAELSVFLNDRQPERTLEIIVAAAEAGLPVFVSVTGKRTELPCPLAFDAGFTWARHHPGQKPMARLSASEAERVVRACYDLSVTRISVEGAAMSAQKAGLLAGAWLGKRQRARTH